MYYHCRDLKYVRHDKVYPPPESGTDPYMFKCYRWLSHYLPGNYCPQVWLSRSHSGITGFKTSWRVIEEDPVLFGFDVVKGFPVDYRCWEHIMTSLMNSDSFEKQNRDIIKFNNDLVEDYKNNNEELDGLIKKWSDCDRDLNVFLQKNLFVENDQVVVPSLNLKVAKKIICRNEKQKKELRKMGFIEDRILIKNIKSFKW